MRFEASVAGGIPVLRALRAIVHEGASVDAALELARRVWLPLLEREASEQGASMTAMDNATRNAGDLINRLTIEYNRSRQAAITTELVEIISGAEAL